MKARHIQPGLAKAFALTVGTAKMVPEAVRPASEVVRHGHIKLPQTRPFSIRLTDAEREALRLAAGSKPIGTFARERLLDNATRRKATRRPAPDTATLGQILATLGRSGVSTSLAELATAARLGTIVITPDMEARLLAVCADIQEVKRLLLRELGLAEERGR